MSAPNKRILLVDDDPQSLESTRKILELAGYDVVSAEDGQRALDLVRGSGGAAPVAVDLVLTDVRMPRLGGLEFLRAMRLCGECVPVILMTAYGRVEDAVWAMKFGAVDFLTKPFKRQSLVSAVEGALKRSAGQASKSATPGAVAALAAANADAALIGNSEPMKKLRSQIAQVAPTAATVLIAGESGTGKELVARCIHAQSARANRAFIGLNCAAVPEQLIESELFVFEQGAFTGATTNKAGLFEAAEGGSLLLDEIGDMPLQLQAKLLRTLQESELRRLGATASRKFDVRVIAASHRDLHEAVRGGTFRQDLLFRLEVIVLNIPALRERLEDLPELAYHFLRVFSRKHEKEIAAIAPGVFEILVGHDWPGNVRELSNVMERAVVFAGSDEIAIADLPPHLVARAGGAGSKSDGAAAAALAGAGGGSVTVKVGTPLKDVEELLIRKTLEATSGDKNMTAKLLGINSRTIYRKLAERDGEESGPEAE